MTPGLATLFDAIDATWPPAVSVRQGPWTIREGRGGGQRVSAATAEAPVRADDIVAAEIAMRAMGQTPLFMIRQGDDALDTMLSRRGYGVVDPVNLRLGPVAPLTAAPLPRARVFTVWAPLAIQLELWAGGGIGLGRIAVMRRVAGPKTSILGRIDHTPAATAFVAIHRRVAMIHALEVSQPCRRQGIARLICRQAAIWAARNGAGHIAALCTRANDGANALYSSLGLEVVGQYHYRKAKEDNPA